MAKSDTENQKVTKMHPLKKGAKVFKNKAIIMVRDSNQNIKFNGKTWKKWDFLRQIAPKANER